MEKKNTATDNGGKVTLLHWKIQQWKLRFQLMDEEIVFIKRLLDSNAFRPNIPNLFERLQDYKTRLKDIENRNAAVRTQISLHENNLGTELDIADSAISADDIKKNDSLQLEVDECQGAYQNLKSEIFNYTGSILNN
ncbi:MULTISPECIES: hypothetical protein [Arenibacter]|uniref:hypothetical protein n=1 Tax=Arenibacter TaxID=178469 RepID=UPI001C074133|nr:MULTISPECIES: hypothetical protein [Arenibacter]MBU2906207.1 hypothetical protein [Arenibacter algicola]MCK0135078.1 hypothetical protein [Arenibacter sp. S6351L]